MLSSAREISLAREGHVCMVYGLYHRLELSPIPKVIAKE